MSTQQPEALAQECADYATSLRSAANVAKLEGRAPPVSFLRAADLFERAASRITELEAQLEAVGAGGVSLYGGDSYGDGNVYRGARSADSAVKTTYTIHELAHAKGVPSIVTNAMLAMGEKLAEAPTPAAQAADSVQEDAARYRWLAASAGAVAGPDDIDAIALTRYKVVHSHDSMFHRFAVVAGDGKQQLYLGREVECENMARKFAGAFLDGAFYQSNIAPTPAAQAADSVQEDAARPDIDAAFEATRRCLCKIPRYSFALDSRGNVRRCEDKSGNWIEFDAAHALFDPVSVDAARKQGDQS